MPTFPRRVPGAISSQWKWFEPGACPSCWNGGRGGKRRKCVKKSRAPVNSPGGQLLTTDMTTIQLTPRDSWSSRSVRLGHQVGAETKWVSRHFCVATSRQALEIPVGERCSVVKTRAGTLSLVRRVFHSGGRGRSPTRSAGSPAARGSWPSPSAQEKEFGEFLFKASRCRSSSKSTGFTKW